MQVFHTKVFEYKQNKTKTKTKNIKQKKKQTKTITKPQKKQKVLSNQIANSSNRALPS